ncbi:MAG: hypothetical protein OFPI_19990 [Osedax symbiont Rs2]|nr:MAG: hypothetical protein OFPI_19990 [Osedax symbiont Rs2]
MLAKTLALLQSTDGCLSCELENLLVGFNAICYSTYFL